MSAREVPLDELLVRASLSPVGHELGIRSVVGDSRRVTPGALFVALPGATSDGLGFIDAAIADGAAAIAGPAGAPVVTRVPYVALSAPHRDFSRLSAAFHEFPAEAVDVVGVTGTNGKTTVSMLVRQLLEAVGTRCGLIGTIRNETGRRTETARMTTPPVDVLQELLGEMRDEGMGAAALEVSSHALDQERIASIPLAVAAVTRVTRDHLDYHGSLERYRETKLRILDHLRPGGHAILNADASDLETWVAAVPDGAKTVLYSFEGRGTINGTIEEMTLRGMSLTVSTEDGALSCATSLIGPHNAENVLLAIAIARALGIDSQEIVAAVENLTAPPGRLESVPGTGGIEVLIDYAHSPDAFERVLGILRGLAAGRLVVLFGCGGDRDAGKRAEMGRIAELLADRVLLTDDNPRTESPERIVRDIRSGMRDPERAGYVPDRREAILAALDEAEEGDLVLLAGKGHEDYQIDGRRRLHHSDREVVEDWTAWRDGTRGKAP